ncbi:MAG: phosphotransferase [Thiobacillus sp.]|nr:phosphotransferase [Thiobacillus sp.]
MSVFLAELSAAIGRATGEAFTATDSRGVAGGDISQAFRLGDGARTFFVKVQPGARLAMFEAEAAGLAALQAAQAITVPRVICQGVAAARAFLVLEHLPFVSQGDASRLGRLLAQQHRIGAARFGWTRDNWIGATAQANAWTEAWVDFWREHRLGLQLRLAADNGYGGALQRDGEILLANLPVFFADYHPAPSLLHGDLWGGNHAYLRDGTPVIFDPAVYFGDRECDLAMSELFGGFAPAFHAAYREAWPLDAGFAARKTLYNLYHILNHANLFGGGYAAQAARMTAQLLAHIR